jgi:hypothetical protein
VFKIIDGKLYLSFNTAAAGEFAADASASIREADAHWKNLSRQQ